MVSVGVGGFIIIFFFILFYFALIDGLSICFELLSWKKCHLDSVVVSSTRGKCQAPEAIAVGRRGWSYWALGVLLLSLFFLFKWTFIFFFSHDFSLFWLGCSLGLLLGKQHWTCSAEKMINGRQNCIQRAVYLGGTSVQWNTALENSRQMVCEIVDKLPSLSSLNEYFHENIGLISPCII